MPKDDRALVEGVNMVKRHTKPNPQKNIKGGILDEGVADPHVEPDGHRSGHGQVRRRVGRKVLEDGRHVRVARRSGAVLDR